jgi:Domain of unknown function (DUF4282)
MAEDGYFSFHSLVSTSIIKVAYLFGALAISSIGIVLIVSGILKYRSEMFGEIYPVIAFGDPVIQFISGIVIFVFANIVWRVLCEFFILLFSIHELLSEILRELRTP